MSSQEEYLDKLLNDLTDDLTKKMTEEDFLSKEEVALAEEMPLIDEMPLTEEMPLVEELPLVDEIFPQEETLASVTEEDIAAADDLMSLLGNSQDEELLEIQDLLQKADNNEPIDDIEALLENIPEEEQSGETISEVDLLKEDFAEEDFAAETFAENDEEADSSVDDLLDDISAGAALAGVLQEDIADGNFVSESQKKAEEKKQQRAARKEAKKAEKEAKKAEKLAQKEAKKAEKAAQKEAQKAELAARKEAKKAAEEQPNVEDSIEEVDLPMDDGLTDDIFGAVGLDDLLADIPDIADISADNSNDSSADSSIESSSTEDDIFAGIASLDLFGESDMESSGIDTLTDSVGEDSLAQIIDDEKKAKRKGFFSRFIDFITEEDEESEDVPISEENRKILKEMDKEGKKKKKDKKLKKGKKGDAPEGEAEGVEDAEQDDKKKKKKEKKPKKEKAPKIVVEEPNGKKLSPKRVITILGICLSICLVIVVCTSVVGDYSVKKAGRKAYYEEDYQTCYQNFYGKHLNESEQVMYSKSESILTMRMWIREYELLVEEGSELEALDSLLQSVYDYPTLYTYAVEWNAGTEVSELYNHILAILSEKYQLTEEQAKEIANTPNDVEYTKMVMAVVAGEAFGSWNQTEENGKEIEVLPDELPEEAGLGDATFVDNKSAK